MNYRSIRFRLTFWYSLTFFLGILLAFVGFYTIAYKILFGQTDTSLVEHGQKVVEVVSRRSENLNEIISQRAFISEFSEIPGMLVTIIDTKGEIVSSSMICCMDAKVFRDLFRRAINTEEYFLADLSVSGENMRFFVSPIYTENLFLGVVLVGHPIDVIQKSLNSILAILGLISIGLLIPAVLGGYYLSKKALFPISELAQNLNYITTENLHQKVKNPHSGDEIEKLITSFNLLLDRLNGAFKRERQFIGDIAHELKTPLSIIKGNVELALSKPRSSKEYQNTLQELTIDTVRMSDTLNSVLDLAWSRADNFKKGQKIIDLSKIVGDLVEITQNLARPKNIKVTAKINKNIFAEGYADKLARSILNVMENAVKYSPVKSTISVNLTKTTHDVRLEVKDKGKGIKELDIPHIFDRFYRSEDVKNLEGSGLGLAIAKGIITAHRGHISIESSPNRGTKVVITLPLSS